MHVSILASPGARHQCEHAAALRNGLARHNVTSDIITHINQAKSDIVACWGWRAGQVFRKMGTRVLVIERGYVGDRFQWSSLGWDGLNGNAIMPKVDDGGKRFHEFFAHLYQPESKAGEYALLIGQVPRDAALGGRDLSNWYLDTAKACERTYGLPTLFRGHPRAPFGSYPKGLVTTQGDLANHLRSAAVVVTYNSNTGVESVLAGKPTISFDSGSMAWDVTAHQIGERYEGDRLKWAYEMAWKQWQVSEIDDGTALEHILRIM
jgi:hypothetical protein